jgi:multisubunit Na+/H+ antiporter MnhF subunit
VNAYQWAATGLITGIGPCVVFCARARPLDGLVALQLVGTMTTLALLCLAEGYHRGAYFGVALVSSILSWVGGLVIARLLARAR